MLRTTRRAVRQNDRIELHLPPESSMAPPGSLQSERLPKMCSLSHRDPSLSGRMRQTALSEIHAATAGRCDRRSMPIHTAHRAATTAAENLKPGAACGGKSEHYD